MSFPLSFWDISLWLAVISIFLLVTSELSSPRYGRINMPINNKRLRRIALAMGALFLMTVCIHVYRIMTSL